MGWSISTSQLRALGMISLLAAALLGSLATGPQYSVNVQQSAEQVQHNQVLALNADVSADKQADNGSAVRAASRPGAGNSDSTRWLQALGLVILAGIMIGGADAARRRIRA